jgi:hypothetical protein
MAESSSEAGSDPSSASLDEVRNQPWVGPLRRYEGPRPRPETLAVFGSRIADMRSEANLSLEVFAESACRSREWVRSIERGLCAPSAPGFDSLELGFYDNEAGPSDIDLRATYHRLDEDPMGDEARLLRSRHGLSTPSSDRLGQDPEGLVPLLHDIAFQDRLLTLTPLAVLALVLALVFGAMPWSGSGYDLLDFDLSAVTFVSLIVVAILTFVMPATSGFLASVSRMTRFGAVARAYADSASIRENEGAVSPGTNWHIPEEVLFSTPRYWGDLRATSLAVDLHERLIVVGIPSVFCTLVALAIAVNASSAITEWVPWSLILIALTVGLRYLLVRRASIAAAVPTLIAECYGLQPEEPSVPGRGGVN